MGRDRGVATGAGLLRATAVLLVTAGCAPESVPPVDRAGVAAGMDQGGTADSREGRSVDVRVEAMSGTRPEEIGQTRNPFRFGSSPPVISEPTGSTPPPSPGPGTLAGGPPPVPRPARPPSALRFIGLVDAPESAGLVAVLTDGDVVIHGRQDEVIDGRYRILGIGLETIEIEYLQDHRREVIPLSGS